MNNKNCTHRITILSVYEEAPQECNWTKKIYIIDAKINLHKTMNWNLFIGHMLQAHWTCTDWDAKPQNTQYHVSNGKPAICSVVCWFSFFNHVLARTQWSPGQTSMFNHSFLSIVHMNSIWIHIMFHPRFIRHLISFGN